MNIYPELPRKWITSPLDPDQIRGQPVRIRLKEGQVKREQFEVEEANHKGQTWHMLIRVDYNSSPNVGPVSFASLRVTQDHFDSWMADKDIVLTVP